MATRILEDHTDSFAQLSRIRARRALLTQRNSPV